MNTKPQQSAILNAGASKAVLAFGEEVLHLRPIQFLFRERIREFTSDCPDSTKMNVGVWVVPVEHK